MQFANSELCATLYQLTGKAAYYAWDCRSGKPTIVYWRVGLGAQVWPAYTLRDLWDMNPRGTTWFKKTTARLGGTCSARTDDVRHYIAHTGTPEDSAATLQIEVERRKQQRIRQLASLQRKSLEEVA